MSHVDEGTLHAYLDGELPSAERAALEAHLAQCEACRARLVDERALLNRANALLGAARPVERPMPAFDQVRRSPKRSAWRVGMPLAWAASIALALGLGYVLHDASYRQASAPLADADKPARVSRDSAMVSTQVAARQDEAKPPPPSQFGLRQRKPANADAAAERRLQPTDSPAFGYMTGRMDSSAMKVAGGAAPAPAGPPKSAAADTPLVIVDAGRPEVAPAAEARGAITARMQREEVLTVREPSAKMWPRIDRQTAKTILGEDPVGLPDLSTLSYRRSPDREDIVVVEQELDSRTVIEIFQQQSVRANARFDSLVYGRSSGNYRYSADRERDRLARFVGKLRVEIGGPVSVDSLNRLLDQVAPLRP